MLNRISGLLVALRVRRDGRTAHAQTTLRVVNHSDLKILDPIWTTAYIVRNHGYMIYDTLFALDGNLEVKPQMVDKWTDLRRQADLDLHPARWARVPRRHAGHRRRTSCPRSSAGRCAMPLGQLLWTKVAERQGARSQDLPDPAQGADRHHAGRRWAKPSGNRLHHAQAGGRDRSRASRSTTIPAPGPFIFVKDEWKPGDKTVYVKNPKYKPRAEPRLGPGRRQDRQGRPRRMGGDPRPADGDERPAQGRDRHDRDAAARSLQDHGGRSRTSSWSTSTSGATSTSSASTSSIKPFDNPKVRQAMLYAFNQKDFLDAVIGDPQVLQGLQGDVHVRHALCQHQGLRGQVDSNFAKAKELLKEGGYDGTPVVLMHSTDLLVLANLAPVAKSLMEKRRHEGRHALDGLADAGQPPRQEGSAGQGRLERLPDLVGRRSTSSIRWPTPTSTRSATRPGSAGPTRRGAGQAARRLRRRDRPGQAQGAGRGHAGARVGEPDARLPRPVVSCRRRCARTSPATSNRR